MNRYLIGALVVIAVAALVLIEVAEPGTVDVPSVVGLTLRDAQGELQSEGLGSGFVYSVRRGERLTRAALLEWQVIRQTPVAGTEVDRGAQVKLRITRQR